MRESNEHWLRFRGRLLRAVLAVASVVAIGTTGYVLVAHYPAFDALYMALTTITTIGYTEVHPLERWGRTFNIFYIVLGVSTLLISLGGITQALIELEISGYFANRRMRRMIEKLDRHYIVCGFGRVGRSAAEELKSEGAKFLIVDRDENRIERAMHLGYLAVATDCTRDESLRELGLPRASGLIAALGSDADNLYLTLTAKTLVPELRIATRVNEDDSEPKLRRAGADVVFAPYKMTGQRLTQSLVRPHVNDFIDLTTGNNTLGLDVRIEQLRVSEECEYVSKSLRQAQLRSELGVIVLAIRRARGEMLFNPPPDAEMSAGDFLIAMGPPARLQLLEAVLAEKKP